MNILLTGAAGFIGSYVARALLERGDSVVCVDDVNSYYSQELKEARMAHFWAEKNPAFYRIDISNNQELSKVFEAHRFDAIVHLAAQAGVRYSLEDPNSYIKSNIVGTHNLLEAAKNFKVNKFVFASSSSVYSGNQTVPWAEIDRVDKPTSLYAVTKRSNELEAYVYHQLHKINMTGLRFFTVYGPWGRPDMAYYLFADSMTRGEKIYLNNNGKMRRDFTYIDDIVDGVVRAVDVCEGYELYNLGNNSPVELEEFVSILEQNFGINATKEYRGMQKADFVESYANIDKAKAKLGWQPQIDIKTGLAKFAEWYKDYHQINV